MVDPTQPYISRLTRQTLLQACYVLLRELQRRPTAEELREHPWVAVDYAPVLESATSVGSPSSSLSGFPVAGAQLLPAGAAGRADTDAEAAPDIFLPTVAPRLLSEARTPPACLVRGVHDNRLREKACRSIDSWILHHVVAMMERLPVKHPEGVTSGYGHHSCHDPGQTYVYLCYPALLVMHNVLWCGRQHDAQFWNAQEEQSRAAEQTNMEAAAVPAARQLNAFQVRYSRDKRRTRAAAWCMIQFMLGVLTLYVM